MFNQFQNTVPNPVRSLPMARTGVPKRGRTCAVFAAPRSCIHFPSAVVRTCLAAIRAQVVAVASAAARAISASNAGGLAVAVLGIGAGTWVFLQCQKSDFNFETLEMFYVLKRFQF